MAVANVNETRVRQINEALRTMATDRQLSGEVKVTALLQPPLVVDTSEVRFVHIAQPPAITGIALMRIVNDAYGVIGVETRRSFLINVCSFFGNGASVPEV